MSSFGEPYILSSSVGRVIGATPINACAILPKIPTGIVNPIVIAERGACTFKKKAMMAENSGAAFLLIVNTKSEDENFIILADDVSRKILQSSSNFSKLKKIYQFQ